MAEACSDCGRPKVASGEEWSVGYFSARADEVAPECGKHLPSYWSDESVPDCLHATVAHQKDRIRALESELAELRKREEWVPVVERLPETGKRVMFWVADWLPDSCPGVGPYEDGERGAYWSDETQMEGPDGDSPRRYYSGGKNGVSHWRPLPARPEPEHRDEEK